MENVDYLYSSVDGETFKQPKLYDVTKLVRLVQYNEGGSLGGFPPLAFGCITQLGLFRAEARNTSAETETKPRSALSTLVAAQALLR